MGLTADLLASIESLPPLETSDVVLGPRFTAVAGAPAGAAAGASGAAPPLGGTGALTTAGVAYTDAAERQPGFDAARATGEARQALVGRPLAQVARSLGGGNAGTGAAALNALLGAQVRASGAALAEDNGLELLAQRGRDRRVAVVGRFPHLEEVRRGAARSWLLELQPEGDELPASAAADVLPEADVVGITGSTLANGTMEGLLALCRRDAFVVVIGPTTPLSPVLFDYGATVLCGVVALEPRLVLDAIAAGGSTRRIAGTRPVALWRTRG